MTTPAPATAQNYTAAGPAPMNTLSVVAFVLSLVGFNVIAIVLGFIGLNQVKKSGQRGRGFALAAVIIGFASILLGLLILIPLIIAATSGAMTVPTSY